MQFIEEEQKTLEDNNNDCSLQMLVQKIEKKKLELSMNESKVSSTLSCN